MIKVIWKDITFYAGVCYVYVITILTSDIPLCFVDIFSMRNPLNATVKLLQNNTLFHKLHVSAQMGHHEVLYKHKHIKRR
jgi:hypothetical protein